MKYECENMKHMPELQSISSLQQGASFNGHDILDFLFFIQRVEFQEMIDCIADEVEVCQYKMTEKDLAALVKRLQTELKNTSQVHRNQFLNVFFYFNYTI